MTVDGDLAAAGAHTPYRAALTTSWSFFTTLCGMVLFLRCR